MSWFDEAENAPGILSVRLSNDAEYVRGVTVAKTPVIIESLTNLIAGIPSSNFPQPYNIVSI